MQRNIAMAREGVTADIRDLLGCDLGVLEIEIQNVDCRAILRKFQRSCSANAASRAGDDGNFSVEAEFVPSAVFFVQRETPRFQGMKSC